MRLVTRSLLATIDVQPPEAPRYIPVDSQRDVTRTVVCEIRRRAFNSFCNPIQQPWNVGIEHLLDLSLSDLAPEFEFI